MWDALLDDMPMTALVGNLATMTRVGLLAQRGEATAHVVSQLGDADRIRRARVHPIALLSALRTYASGRGARGRGTRAPVRAVVDAFDAAFYKAFENVEPTGKRLLLALDVSGSMGHGEIAGVPGLTPLAISPRQRLDDAVKTVDGLPFGGTDCALPMLYAQAREFEIDTFSIYTDSRGDAMNRVYVPRVSAPVAARERGAKVISLDARRKARAERFDPRRQPPKQAA